MVNVLTSKLELFGRLPEHDKRLLDEVTEKSRSVPAATSIIREGDAPSDVHLVMEGLACRSKLLKRGARHIFAYLVPGDLCDANIFILKAMDHTIETLAPSRIVDVPRARILEMMDRPAIARALWWATLVDEATLREWLVNLGQRDALHRIAHLFCELHLRMQSVGLTKGGSYQLPITQSVLGETMGLSPVHVNRALQSLRSTNLITFKAGELVINDIPRLQAMCEFNPNYLHLDGGKRNQDGAVPH